MLGFLLFIQVMTIVGKLVGYFPWGWGMVFVPLYLGIAMVAFLALLFGGIVLGGSTESPRKKEFNPEDWS